MNLDSIPIHVGPAHVRWEHDDELTGDSITITLDRQAHTWTVWVSLYDDEDDCFDEQPPLADEQALDFIEGLGFPLVFDETMSSETTEMRSDVQEPETTGGETMSTETFNAFRDRGYRALNLRRCTAAARINRPIQVLARIIPNR